MPGEQAKALDVQKIKSRIGINRYFIVPPEYNAQLTGKK
jgi:hypothetical protein